MQKNTPLLLSILLGLGIICVSQTGCRFTGPPYKPSSWQFHNPFSHSSKSSDEDELAKHIDDEVPSYASTLPKTDVTAPRDGYSQKNTLADNSSSRSSANNRKIAKSDTKYDSKVNTDPLADLYSATDKSTVASRTASPGNRDSGSTFGTTVPASEQNLVAANTLNHSQNGAQAGMSPPYSGSYIGSAAPMQGAAAGMPNNGGYHGSSAVQPQTATLAQNSLPPGTGMGIPTGATIGSPMGTMADPNMMMANASTTQSYGLNSNGAQPYNQTPYNQTPYNQTPYNPNAQQTAGMTTPGMTTPSSVAQNGAPGNYPATGNYPGSAPAYDPMTASMAPANTGVGAGQPTTVASNAGTTYSNMPVANAVSNATPNAMTAQPSMQGATAGSTPYYYNTPASGTASLTNPGAVTAQQNYQQPANGYNAGFSSFAPTTNDGYRPGGY